MLVYPHYMGGWGVNWPALVSLILFWALVVIAIVALIRFLRSRPHPGPSGYGWPGPGPYPPPPGVGTPEHILAERYARGEIDEQEFQRRMSVLRGGAGQPSPPGSAPPPAAP